MMILVDSSVWIDFFNGSRSYHAELLSALLGKELILLGDIILLEVLQGFKSDRDYHVARKALEAFPVKSMTGKQLAVECAENYRYLRKKGITPRKTIDMIIGTYCIMNDCYLLYSDRDFDPLVQHLGLKSAIPPEIVL
jgi:predicted nucleic acid-binding protein